MNALSLQEVLRLAIQHHQAGQLAQAEALYRRILQQQPQHADALHLLGVVALQVGQYATAADLIGQAIARNAKSPEYQANLGEALRSLGRLDEAVAAYRKAIRLNPKFAAAYNNLGIALKQQGKGVEAITAYRRAIGVKPDYFQALNNLAIALKEQGDIAAAVTHYRQALALNPGSAETHSNLGVALNELGAADQADGHFRQAIALRPEFAEAHEGWGNALRALGRLDDAAAAYRAAIRCKPGFAQAYNNLGVVLKELGQAAEAIQAYQQAIALNPNLAQAHNNFGIVLKEQGLLELAAHHLNQAIALKPGYAQAYNNLGLVLEIQGEVDVAIAAYRQAMHLNPALSRAHSNVLFALNYLPRHDCRSIFEEHVRWAKTYAEPLGATVMPPAISCSAGERLRIGYVSPDFRKHPLAYFIESVLVHHDSGQFEITCYSDVCAPDEVTHRLRRLPQRWRDIHGLDDGQVFDLVRSDGIDILVDLAGHTDRNRLLLFARKPAPVQASWIGYFNTTGLSTMDYFITDRYGSPEGQERFFSEKPVRLPHSRFCYRPPDYAPEVAPQPVLRNGYVTFGSFNNLAKVNSEVVSLWGEILRALPDSRLFLKSLALNDDGARRRYLELFSAQGVAPERIGCSGHSPHTEMLNQYGAMDIALDTFPFTGGLTTCEALWMGVPVVTLAGEALVSRQSASLLMNLDRGGWVAESPQRYVEIALNLAADATGLTQQRSGLREVMRTSAVCNAAAFTRDLEEAYQKMR
ncbi:MAG: tetratricopeptide repeat protein [Sulfuricellaceae bacterium]